MREYVKFRLFLDDVELLVREVESLNYPQIELIVYYGETFLSRYFIARSETKELKEKLKNRFKNFISMESLLMRIKNDVDIPIKLKKSVIYCIEKRMINELVSGLLIDYNHCKMQVLNQMNQACEILGLNLDQLIDATDYNHRDQRRNRINNALAEVRAVIALNQSGFTEIALSAAKSNHQKADIIATRDSIKYAIDVKHHSNYNNEDADKRFLNPEEFERYFRSKISEKSTQLESSLKLECTDDAMVFFVIDEITGLYALDSYEEQYKVFKEIYENLKSKYSILNLGLCFNGEVFIFTQI